MYVGIPGAWKNFEEMEEYLCLAELQALRAAIFEKENDNRRFLAAMQGVDLDKGKAESADDRMAAVKRRANARLAGMTESEFDNLVPGFEYEGE